MLIDEIKRDKCAILSLVLKSKWYDMIDHGKKHEEYRDSTEYWRRRLHNWDKAFTPQKTPVVEFRRGYASNAPRGILQDAIRPQKGRRYLTCKTRPSTQADFRPVSLNLNDCWPREEAKA